MVLSGALASTVLWGPPGCGKTTIARLLADHTDMLFAPLSAVFSGVAELRKVFAEARDRRVGGTGTLLFVDEIHRFNRAQQDAFLPVVEDGTVILVGATTENPSFELNGALLSRCGVLVLNRLDDGALGDPARARRGGGWPHPAARRGRPPDAARHGGRRRPHPHQHGRGAVRIRRGPTARRGGADGDRAAPRAALRQGAGGPLQPDLGAAQVAQGLGHRRRALLARADAGGRRGPPLYRPPPGALRRGRRGPRRPRRLAPGASPGWEAYERLGSPEGDSRHRPDRDLSRHRGPSRTPPTGRSRAP